MREHARALLTSVALVTGILLSSFAEAQETNKIAIGAAIVGKQATGGESHGTLGRSFIWRFGEAKEGWGLKYGTSWYSQEIDREIGGERQSFGRLRVMPFMAGYGYTHVMGRTSISGNLQGGYAFTKFSVHEPVNLALRSSLGLDRVEADVSNTFVVKPELSVWTDLSKKIGVNVSAGYMVARPFVSVSTGGSRSRTRIKADSVILKVGVVYSIF